MVNHKCAHLTTHIQTFDPREFVWTLTSTPYTHYVHLSNDLKISKFFRFFFSPICIMFGKVKVVLRFLSSKI